MQYRMIFIKIFLGVGKNDLYKIIHISSENHWKVEKEKDKKSQFVSVSDSIDC